MDYGGVSVQNLVLKTLGLRSEYVLYAARKHVSKSLDY